MSWGGGPHRHEIAFEALDAVSKAKGSLPSAGSPPPALFDHGLTAVKLAVVPRETDAPARRRVRHTIADSEALGEASQADCRRAIAPVDAV
jgi:hypothetical protein